MFAIVPALPLLLASPLFWIIVGFAALLLVHAMQPLIVRPVQELVGAMPIWGNDLKRAVGEAAARVHANVVVWADQQLQGLVEWVSVPIRTAYDFVDGVADFVDATVAQINAVARAASLEIGAAGRAIQAISARLSATIASAAVTAAQLPRLWSELNRVARVLIPAAIATATAGIMHSVGVLVRNEALTRGRAIDDVRIHTGRAIDGEARTRAGNDAALAGSIGAVSAELLRRLTDAEGRSRTYADQRARGVEQGLEHVRDIALPATLAVALAATNVLARDYASTRARCIDPVCSAITPGLDFLNALGTGALLLTVLSMVGDAVRDPQGTAGDTAAGAGGIIGLARDTVGAFVPAAG